MNSIWISLVALFFTILTSDVVYAADVELVWNIEYVDFNMSGLFTRRAIGVNGKWPIPGVVAKLGDTLVIHANNKLDEPTSLHSHGIFQNGTNYYDGAAMITECGIPPGGSFTYRIPLLQSGTYWIHSHFKAQTTDGLRTSLVIRDPNEHYEYDHEMILTFEDWYKEHAHTIIKQLSDPDPYARYKLIIPYGLINGECISTKNITFAPGKTYRLRLLNIGASLEFHFQIDHHDMHLIEIDGVPIKERVTRGVTLAAGQRASVLVTAKESTSSNYLFHADMYTDLFRLPKYNPYNFTGVVEYAQGAKVKREINPGWHTVDDIDLHPLDNEPLMEPTVSLTMDAYSGVFDDKTYRHSFDNITYVEPHVPSLLTALTTGDMAKRKEVYGRMSNAHIVKYHDVVQITIRNHDYYTHPFHLHGHVFQIVEKGSIRKKDHELKVTALGAPVKRDTFILRGGQYAILRFRADNPGVWLFHCHIDFHVMLGLQTVFVSAPDKIQQRLSRLPESLKANCLAQGIKTEGNAVGGQGIEMNGQDDQGPNPLPSQFESYEQPSAWQMLSYMLETDNDSGPEATQING